MSYLRYGPVFKYVSGESKDYIFRSAASTEDKDWMEDYGTIHDESLVELIAQALLEDDTAVEREIFLNTYLVRKLADRLDVKMRDKYLSQDQQMKLYFKRVKEFQTKMDSGEVFGGMFKKKGGKHAKK